MPDTIWDDSEAVKADEPKVNWSEYAPVEDKTPETEWSQFQAVEQPSQPPITLSPYEKYRLEGREPVAGPFGPANPAEVLALPQILKAPAAAIEQTGIPQAFEEIGADFLRRSGINPAARAGETLIQNPNESGPRSPLEEAFPKFTKGIEEGLKGFITPGTAVLAPFASLKPVQAAFETQMISGVPQSVEELASAQSPEEAAKALLQTAAGLTAGAKVVQDIPKVTEQAPPSEQPGEAKPSGAPVSASMEAPVVAGTTPQPMAETATPPEPAQGENVTSPVTEQPELVGMGGATPAEFTPSQQSPTGIRNAVVDQERVKRGLPPAMDAAKRSFGEVWDRAMALLDRDPEAVDNLINSIERKPRALTDSEDALLLHRQIDLQNEYSKATRDLSRAYEDGQTEVMQAERARVADLSDRLQRIYDVGKEAGRETARGLNARRMMANEDFSLAKMDIEMRAARGGKPVTETQRQWYQEMHDKIAATQKAYDDYVARTNEKISELTKTRPYIAPPIIKAAERLVSQLDTRADAARARLKARMGRMSAGVDPTILVDLAEIGAAHIAHTGLDFAEWSARMVSELGDWVKPHLQQVFEASQKSIDTIGTTIKEGSKEAVKAVKGGFQALNPAEQRASTVAAVKKKVAEGKNDSVTWYVQRLARALVGQGVKDRETLIDAVHQALQEAIPGITRRDTMDAISGYGDFKQLSKDDISITLRGMKGEMQQLAKLEDMAAGKPPLKSGLERRTPTDAERDLIKAVNDAKNKFQIPVQDPNTQLKSALDTIKTTLPNRIKDYQDRLARGDYSARPRRTVALDEEASRLKAENERLKKLYRRGVEMERIKNMDPKDRALNWVTRWRRGFVLSGYHTLGKLTTAAIYRMASTPVEEAIGAVYSKLVPGVASRAPREGGFNVRAEAKALTRSITRGMSDAAKTLKTGQSDLEILYGKEALLPPAAIDFFGHVHGALKSPAKRAEFERSLEKRTAHAIRSGVDVSDPLVQSGLVIDSYKDAKRSIFLQDNRLVTGYKRMLQSFEQKDKETGKVPLSGKTAATLARVVLPVVKVPVNIVAETVQYALGAPIGAVELARAFVKGFENLKPDEADMILRHMKKGSLGAAFMLMGFFNPQMFGGYYQPGQRRKPSDVKVGSMKVEGYNIPSFLLHNPLLETMQIGATARRVADSKLHGEQQGITAGIIAAALGLAQEIPFLNEPLRLAKLFGTPAERQKFLQDYTKSLLVPQGVQEAAQFMDKNAQGETTKRKPKNLIQAVESGIPVLRENVPTR